MDKATTSVASAWLLDSKRQRSGSVTEILQGRLRISRARLSHSAHQQLLTTASSTLYSDVSCITEKY